MEEGKRPYGGSAGICSLKIIMFSLTLFSLASQVPNGPKYMCSLFAFSCMRAFDPNVLAPDALLLTDREHQVSAEEERAAEIPGANIVPPPKHDPSQYFFSARSNQRVIMGKIRVDCKLC